MKKIDLTEYNLSDKVIKKIKQLRKIKQFLLINMLLFIIYTLISALLKFDNTFKIIGLATIGTLLVIVIVIYYVQYKELITLVAKDGA
ncbi:MAG: hypothetical protein GX312_01940 [Candidatus Phytoplasma sp.]|nr:hypothetical protein [Phytoplasma sp.]